MEINQNIFYDNLCESNIAMISNLNLIVKRSYFFNTKKISEIESENSYSGSFFFIKNTKPITFDQVYIMNGISNYTSSGLIVTMDDLNMTDASDMKVSLH